MYCGLMSYPPPNPESPDSRLFKTTTGGGIGGGDCPDKTYWTEITPPLDVRWPNSANASITAIAVHPQNPGVLWVSYSHESMITAHIGVMHSSDGGLTWTNVSNGLPATSIHDLAIDQRNNCLYAATEVGVYYRAEEMTEWKRYGSGLPHVLVYELEISYSFNLLRIATFGRGAWEAELID
jgi:hypothetical protein